MSPIPLHRRRRPESTGSGTQQWHAPAVDPALLKLQERLEAIEARRAHADQQVPAAPPVAAHHAGEQDPGIVIDLDGIGEAAQRPTAATIADETRALEERLEVLERRLGTAESQARSADARARAAAARAEDILFALPDLAHELRLLVDAEGPTIDQLEAAIDRMRARVAAQAREEVAPELESAATPELPALDPLATPSPRAGRG